MRGGLKQNVMAQISLELDHFVYLSISVLMSSDQTVIKGKKATSSMT